MKKIILSFGLMVLLFGSVITAQAVTVTFDEVPAWNASPAGGGKWVGEEFASKGVHFLPNYYGFTPYNWDGVVYDPPAEGGPFNDIPAIDGQYLGLDGEHPDGGNGNLGMCILFDGYITSFTMDVYPSMDLTGAFWVFDTAQGTALGTEVGGGNWPSQVYPPEIPANGWTNITVGNGDVPFNFILMAGAFTSNTPLYYAVDNLTYEPIPVPASVLLLASGLLPLIRLRRKK